MAHNGTNVGVGAGWPAWRVAIVALDALALGLSAYLSWHFLAGGSVAGCGGGSPCDQVLASRWSSIAGVLPVSGLAMGVYLALLAASFSIGPGTAAPVRRLAWRAMLVLVGAAAASAVWFTIVQRWIVGAFCPYCMATHVIGVLLAGLVIWQAPGQLAAASDHDALANEVGSSQRRSARSAAFGAIFLGVGLAGALVLGQVMLRSPVRPREGNATAELSSLDPHATPLIGSADARYVVTLLFDYECPHCQQLHFMLDEAVRRYGGKLAFALSPVPLNSQCNPYVSRDSEQFRDSCELTRIALAVWRARREAFPEFDRWMFTLDSGAFWRPRRPDAARTKAVELVGETKLAAAFADPWVERYLQKSVRIYGQTLQGSSAVPKLIYGSHWVVPAPQDAADLLSILNESLAVPKP